MAPAERTFIERARELIGQIPEPGQRESEQGLGKKADQIINNVRPADAQAARILNGWHKRVKGEITHQQLEDGLTAMFRDRMMDMLSEYSNYTLFKFLQGDLSLENFLGMGDEDRNHDYAVWKELEGLAMLTRQYTSAAFQEIEKHFNKWIVPSMEYRQQFLDEHGNIVTSAPKGLEEEWRRLKQSFHR